MKADRGTSAGILVSASGRRRGLWPTLLKTLRKPQFQFGVVTLIPILIWYCVFVFWSVIQGFRIALIHYRIVDPSRSRFVGLDNFRYLFDDPLFPVALKN